ncbi:MAG: NTP transferase domain-containing protein [Betaproteobacteria bacterium AqS2]|uniref:NTP transferase domain-containing protein n=1 Tax=Candidatus Amphirhobacter heronislandensis TaxID=1732024 RepID=A0A930XXG9_9GAMM|nr:NTP transferase domain-containing protein [Betaproteobacteria bacterium AqS2]
MARAPAAFVLAAGLGTRLGALGASTPKPLLRVGGRSLLERLLRRLAAAGVRHCVINVHHHAAKVMDAIGDGSACGLHVSYSVEAELLGVGGGVAAALPLLGTDPFIVANADTVSDFDFGLLDPAALGGADGLLVLGPKPPDQRRGDFSLRGGRVSFAGGGPRRSYVGAALYRKRLFSSLEPGMPASMRPLWEDAIARGALAGLAWDGGWRDAGTPERLAQARAEASGG